MNAADYVFYISISLCGVMLIATLVFFLVTRKANKPQEEPTEEKELEEESVVEEEVEPDEIQEEPVAEEPQEEPIVEEPQEEPVVEEKPQEEEQSENPEELVVEDPKLENLDEENLEDDEEEDEDEITIYGVRLNKSFKAKVSLGTQDCRDFYKRVKEHILSYGLKPRAAWDRETLYLGRKNFAVFTIKGKTLSMHIALNPEEYTGGMYKNDSEVKKYEDVPLRIRIKSNRSVKLACLAVDKLALERGYKQKDTPEVVLEPVRSLEENMQLGLIKEVQVKQN